MKSLNWMTYSSCFLILCNSYGLILYIFFPVTVLAVNGGGWTPEETNLVYIDVFEGISCNRWQLTNFWFIFPLAALEHGPYYILTAHW